MSIAEEFQSALGAAGQSYERQMQRPGLSLAVVTNINDEEKLNRVKCLPIENENKEETDWCYVMAPLGGKQCGQFFFPNVNDLVVLGYLGGDPHRPIVLGAYWTTQFPPPYTIQDGKVYNFSIKTPNGTELLFYDEPKKQKVTLTLPSGTVLSIDDENQAVALKDKAGDNALTSVQFNQTERRGRDRADKPEYKVKVQAAFCFSNVGALLEYYHKSSRLEHDGAQD